MPSGAERILILKMVSDVSQATAGINKVNSTLGSVGKVAAGIGGAFLASQAVGQVMDFAQGAVDAASNIAESQSKLNVLLGKSSDTVLQFAEDAADAYGISEEAALEYGGNLANLFKAMGKTDKAAADSSKEFLGLAADLASFNNTSVDDALTALQAGLRGESEPLRKFGVLLDDATLRAKAMELGLVKTTKEALDPQTKALAAQAVIMEQTTDAQGDFARTSDGLANSQKKVNAQLDNVTAEIGEALLPIVQELLALFVEHGLPIIRKVWEAFKRVAAVVGPLLAPLLDAMAELFVTIWDAIAPLVEELLPPLLSLLGKLLRTLLPALTTWFKLVAAAVRIAVDAVKTLVRWVKDALDFIGDLLAKIPKIEVPNISVPWAASGSVSGAPSAAGLLAAPRSTGSGGVGGIVVNVYTSGDTIEAERAVVRALNRSVRLNAGLAAPVRWSTAPGAGG